MLNFSFWDIFLILILCLILFGPEKMPGIARSMGKGLAEFRNMTNKVSQTFRAETEDFKKDIQENMGLNELLTDEEKNKDTAKKTNEDNKINL